MPDKLVISYQTTNMHHDRLEQAELIDRVEELNQRDAQHILCHKTSGEMVCIKDQRCENCGECLYASS